MAIGVRRRLVDHDRGRPHRLVAVLRFADDDEDRGVARRGRGERAEERRGGGAAALAEHDVHVDAVGTRSAAPALADPPVEVATLTPRSRPARTRRPAALVDHDHRAPSPRRSRPSACSTSSSAIRSDTTSLRSKRPSTTSCAISPSARDVRRTVVAAGDRLLAQELDRRQRHLDAAGARPTTIAVPPGRSTSQACRIVAALPTTSKASLDPAAETRAPSTRRTPRRAPHGSPTAPREPSLPVGVDRHDHRRAGQPRAGDHLQADTAAADHAHGCADAKPAPG